MKPIKKQAKTVKSPASTVKREKISNFNSLTLQDNFVQEPLAQLKTYGEFLEAIKRGSSIHKFPQA
jgi:hypothetical protein